MTIDTTNGQVGIGKTPGVTFDVLGRASLAYGYGDGALILGADVNAITRSINTRKVGYITVPTYASASETHMPFGFDAANSGQTIVYFGTPAGSSTQYGVTDLVFTTQTGPTLKGGTERMRINKDGLVGIGTASPSSKLHLSETRTATSTANTQVNYVEAIYNPDADSVYYWAGQKTSLFKDGTTNLTANIPLRAFYPSVENRGSGNVSSMAAGMLYVANTGTGTVTSGYGLYVYTPAASLTNPITNYYGVYIGDAQKTGITNGYALYSSGASDKSYLAGTLGVGVVPLAKLHSQATTEQLRLGYDASNYLSATIGSTGSATFALTGTTPIFTFSQAVKGGGGFQSSDGTAGATGTQVIVTAVTQDAGTKDITVTTKTITFKNGLITSIA
jgi:hypothetical protein